METKFYHFRQNNSGGSFRIDEEAGIGINVIIEGTSPSHANFRAEEIGLYFNGCDDGTDCPCCGDRWYNTSASDGEDVPTMYGDAVGDVEKDMFCTDCYVHYIDGTIKHHIFKEKA